MTRGKIRSSKDRARHQAAETLAVAALAFLASEPEHLGDFLAVTGVGPDHFSGNEPLLIAFAQHQGIDPTEVERARAALGSVWERDLP